jgi:hypothetical protein
MGDRRTISVGVPDIAAMSPKLQCDVAAGERPFYSWPQCSAGGPSNTGSQSCADCHIGFEASQCGLRIPRIPSYFRYQRVPILLVYKGEELEFEPSLDRGESSSTAVAYIPNTVGSTVLFL